MILTRSCYHEVVPKLIDHDHRREEIAEATWRVILAHGTCGVSIRNVAAEAGISTGSLRHVFPSKTDLLVHAMQLVSQRARERIRAHFTEPDPRTLVLSVIREVLPLDAARRAELEVNLALIAEAPGNQHIRQVRDGAYQALRDACKRMVLHLQQHGLTKSSIDLEEATTALHGLIDGLAIHMLISNEPAFEQQALRIIETSIDQLR